MRSVVEVLQVKQTNFGFSVLTFLWTREAAVVVWTNEMKMKFAHIELDLSQLVRIKMKVPKEREQGKDRESERAVGKMSVGTCGGPVKFSSGTKGSLWM